MVGIELLENTLHTFLVVCCLSGEFREKTVDVLCEHEMDIERDKGWDIYHFRINGELHRETSSLPSIIWSDGSKCWRKNGKNHREYDLPAYIGSDGTKYWRKNGKWYSPKKLK